MKHTTAKNIKVAYKQYKSNHLYDLNECYNSCSYAKHQAWRYCQELAHKYDNYLVSECLKIIGFNSQTFSAGFVGLVDGRKAFFYITKLYDRFIFLDELED